MRTATALSTSVERSAKPRRCRCWARRALRVAHREVERLATDPEYAEIVAAEHDYRDALMGGGEDLGMER